MDPVGLTISPGPRDFTLGDRELIAPPSSLFKLFSFEDDFDRDFRERYKSVNFCSLAFLSLGLAPSSEGGGCSEETVEEEGAAVLPC